MEFTLLCLRDRHEKNMTKTSPGSTEDERHVAQSWIQRQLAVKLVGAQMRSRKLPETPDAQARMNGGYVKSLSFGVVRYTMTMATIAGHSRYEALGKLLSLYLSFFV